MHFPALCKVMGLEWSEVKGAIACDPKFRAAIEAELEKFKFEIYQQCLSRALGKNAVKGGLDLPAVKAVLALIDSGALIPGAEVKKGSIFGDGEKDGPNLMERIGLKSTDT